MIWDQALKLNGMEAATRTVAKWKAQTAAPPVPPPGFESIETRPPQAPFRLDRQRQTQTLTMNRNKYHPDSKGDLPRWLVADNPDAEGFFYTVRRDDTVVLYAPLKGIAQGHKEWRK